MDYKEICGAASYAITVLGLLVYAWGIIAASKKPSVTTWAIWTLNSFLLPFSYHELGAVQTVWLAAGYATGCVIITILAIKVRGGRKWTKVDAGCLLACLVAGMVWWITRSAYLAFVTALVIDAIGIMPTIEGAYKEPKGESGVAWVLMLIGGVLSICAVKEWKLDSSTYIDASYPIQITITCAIIVALLYWPRRATHLPR